MKTIYNYLCRIPVISRILRILYSLYRLPEIKSTVYGYEQKINNLIDTNIVEFHGIVEKLEEKFLVIEENNDDLEMKLADAIAGADENKNQLVLILDNINNNVIKKIEQLEKDRNNFEEVYKPLILTLNHHQHIFDSEQFPEINKSLSRCINDLENYNKSLPVVLRKIHSVLQY